MPKLCGTDRGARKTVDAVDIVVTYGEGCYAIAAVNKDPEKAQTIDLSIIEDEVSEYRIHTLNGPSVDSYNDIGRDEVGIKTGEWQNFTGSLSLEAHSVNVIELR